MGRQGQRWSEHEKGRLCRLLADSELSLREIAERVGCSASAVAALNRRMGIRHYAGRRNKWLTRAAADATRTNAA